jgi:hypothetical protein
VSKTKGTVIPVLDYRTHFAAMLAEDRMRSLRHERTLQRQLRPVRPPSETRVRSRRRWKIADVVARLVPSRIGGRVRGRTPLAISPAGESLTM